MAKMSVMVLPAVVGGIAALTLRTSAGAKAAKTRVIDRTLRCTIPVGAGIRELNVASQAGVRDQGDRSKWFALPHVEFFAPGGGVSFGIQAGGPASPTGTVSRDWRYWFETKRCRSNASRIPLSARGLQGGFASQLRERYECVTPRVVSIRLRGEFRSPASLRVGRGFQWTAATVKAGYVAARSEAGKPLVYAEIFETGKARLFLARSCREE